jgi:hypothetical protein
MRTSDKYSGRKLKKPDLRQVGNFTQIPNAFILNPKIKDPELRLLLFIMMYSENKTITTKNCILYLCKSKPSIYKSYKKLIALGILRISDETIEVIIPEEMKKFNLGYLQGKENFTTKVKKALPLESENTIHNCKENLTIEVNKTLPPSKENITPEVKNSFKKPLEDTQNDNVINSVILSNTRVLPVPAESGSTEHAHSNSNTKGKTGIELDLECVTLTSARIPSGVPQTLHTPIEKVKNIDKELSLPIIDIDNDSQPTVELETRPIEPDKRFDEQLEIYYTSKYFLPEKLDKVKSLYNAYAKQYPNKYMPIIDFEEVLVYLMTSTLRMVQMKGINFCLIYYNDILHYFDDIPQIRQDMLQNPNEVQEILKKSELNN